ncbi:MAG: hypothetical protein AAF086_03780 [Planctomycetota bacterium]
MIELILANTENMKSIRMGRLLEIVSSPLLLFLVVTFVTLFVTCLISPTKRWYALGAMLFFSIPGPAVDFWKNWIQPPPPLDQLVLYGRSVTAASLVFAFVILTSLMSQIRPIIVPPLVAWLYGMQTLLCLRHVSIGNVNEAAARWGVWTMVFVAFGIALPTLIYQRRNLFEPVKIMGLAITIYALITAYEIAFFYHWGTNAHGRWLGITANPNHAGLVGALFTPALLACIFYKPIPKLLRFASIGVLGIVVVQTMLTGSRGAALTGIIATAFYFRVQLGRLLLAVVPVALVAYFTLGYLGEGTDSVSRLTSTQNTRTESYAIAFERAMQNPIFGNTPGEIAFLENAYLGYFIHTGLIGMVVLGLAMWTGLILVWKSIRIRSNLPESGPLVDAGIAGLAAVAANSMVEATFMSNLSQSIFVIYLYATLLHLAVKFGTEATQPQLPVGTPMGVGSLMRA